MKRIDRVQAQIKTIDTYMEENTKKLDKIEQNTLRIDGLETNIDRIDTLDPSVATWAELGYSGAESRTMG